MKIKKSYLGIAFVTVIALATVYESSKPRKASDETASSNFSKAKVTFVELGSVNCIPCRAMQPVMRTLEKRYGDQIHIIFHDVWQDDTPARTYGIRAIPTQVFLDQDGHEFHRHEGFYPLEQIEKLLLAKGLKIVNGS